MSSNRLNTTAGMRRRPHGALTVLTAGTTRRSIVERLTPSAVVDCLRLYANRRRL